MPDETPASWTAKLLLMFIAAVGAWTTCMVDLVQQADQAAPYKLSQIYTRYLLPQVSEPTALWIALFSVGLVGAVLVLVHNPASRFDAFNLGLAVFAVMGVSANPSEEVHRQASWGLVPSVYAQQTEGTVSIVWGKQPLSGEGKLKLWDADGRLIRELKVSDQITPVALAPGEYSVEMRATGLEPIRFELKHQAGNLGYFLPAQSNDQAAWKQLFSSRTKVVPVPLKSKSDFEAILNR